ncbi:MAG: hypothetical protein LC754_10495 [Acidobacteria bacterium]|nr:hypothetical protein [Acidobacteriota bacterium]
MSLDGSVIGGLIGRSDELDQIRKIGVSTEHFADPLCRKAYAAMLTLRDDGLPIDRISVAALLGGSSDAWLTERALEGSPDHVVSHATLLRRQAVLNAVAKSAESFAWAGEGDQATRLLKYREALQEAQTLMTSLSAPSENDTLETALNETMGHLTGESPDPDLIDTGLGRLNKLLGGGLMRGDLTVIAGATSQGKTGLLTTVVHRASVVNGTPSVIYSYEMTTREIAQRLISMESGIALSVIRKGNIENEEHMTRLSEAIARVGDRAVNGIVEVVPAHGMTAEDIHADVAKRAKSPAGLGLVGIDYLQLVETSASLTRASRATQVANVSRMAKRIAGEFGVCVLGLSQLNRAADYRGGDPQLSDLRESGALEQDANQVLFVFDAPGNTPLQAKCPANHSVKILDLQKNRNGQKGRIEAYFYGVLTQFVDAPVTYMGGQ